MSFENPDQSIPVFVFRLIVGLISIIGNGVILYIALRFKQFCSSVSNCLIVLLACCEFIIGIGILVRASYTFYLASENITIFNRINCMMAALPEIFGITFGETIMLSMAIDRFMAVRKPTQYYTSNSRKRVFITVAVGIVAACFFCCFSLVNLESTLAVQCSSGASATFLFAVLWTSFGINVAIFMFAIYGYAILLIYRSKVTNDVTNLSMKRQRKVFAYISLILFSYALFYFIPLVTASIITLTSMNPLTLGYTSLVIGLTSGINSCFGIFIYLAKHQELKENFLKILPSFLNFDQKGKTNVPIITIRTTVRPSVGTYPYD